MKQVLLGWFQTEISEITSEYRETIARSGAGDFALVMKELKRATTDRGFNFVAVEINSDKTKIKWTWESLP